MTSRRRFIQIVPAAPLAAAALLGARTANAQANLLSEKDATAVSLAYVADATKSKHANYKAGNACNNCALYQGKAADAAAACPLFAGKVVAGKGWCSAYAAGGPAKK